jgi:hypothetical protein
MAQFAGGVLPGRGVNPSDHKRRSAGADVREESNEVTDQLEAASVREIQS